MSIKSALDNYSRRNIGIKKNRERKAKNESPEKKVEKEILDKSKNFGFDLSVVDSSANYSRSAGRYLHGKAESGFPDIVGNDSRGTALFIELKALGRRSTLSRVQYEFLVRKIRMGAFAVCVDSADMLINFYHHWYELRLISETSSEQYLMDQLPKKFSEPEAIDHEFGF